MRIVDYNNHTIIVQFATGPVHFVILSKSSLFTVVPSDEHTPLVVKYTIVNRLTTRAFVDDTLNVAVHFEGGGQRRKKMQYVIPFTLVIDDISNKN